MVVNVIFHFISKGKGPFVNFRNKKELDYQASHDFSKSGDKRLKREEIKMTSGLLPLLS